MKFKIGSKIFERYAGLIVGVVVAKNVDNKNYSEEIQKITREAERKVRETVNPEKLAEVPVIAKWRETYASFGAKPRDYRSSIEALVRRALKSELPKINLLVDLYNYISIKYLLTVGGEDIDKMQGDLVLDFAEGTEEFIPLGSDKNEPPWKGEVVYKDDRGVVCRCLNWREGNRTKLTEETKNCVLVIEGLPPITREQIETAVKELKELVQKFCGGSVSYAILDNSNSRLSIEQRV